MGWRVALTPEAEADLQGIVTFIAEQSPMAARQIGEELLDLIFSLDHLPRRGAPMALRSNLRKLPHRHVLIIYRIDEMDTRVDIVRLWAGRRNPARFEVSN